MNEYEIGRGGGGGGGGGARAAQRRTYVGEDGNLAASEIVRGRTSSGSSTRPRFPRAPSSFGPRKSSHYWGMLITLLSLFYATEAYLSVSMSNVCKHGTSRSFRLSPEAAIKLHLDASNSIVSNCRVELIAPETHSISLLFVRRNVPEEKKTDATEVNEKRDDEDKSPKCPLVVSFPVMRPEEVKMYLDLCSEKAFKLVEPYTDLLPPRIVLDWIPNVKKSDEILASEIVIAAVGRGHDVCSQPGQFPCKSIVYPVYCVSNDLVCDGKKNCPFEGRDEDEEMCSLRNNYEKVGLNLGDGAKFGRGWEFLASEFLKKFTSKDGLSHLKRSESSYTTEKSTVLWSDDGSVHARDSESLPDVLKHYGPWGYLMLGMLICGTVLMFCGLWECCCRRPKALVSNAVGPALLFINQGAQQNEVEVPTTPGPPRYEELDQPPSYSTLFPPSKTGSVGSPTNPLPIALPIVSSLTSLLTNNSSSQLPPLPNPTSQGTDSSSPPTVFTIELQNTNAANLSGDQEVRAK